jgi:hypothetical protein
MLTLQQDERESRSPSYGFPRQCKLPPEVPPNCCIAFRALQVVTSDVTGEEQMTLTVLGHQIVRKPEAYGLRLRTQEFGDVVFSVPQAILRRLITNLTYLASSSPALQAFGSGDATGQARGKIGAHWAFTARGLFCALLPP